MDECLEEEETDRCHTTEFSSRRWHYRLLLELRHPPLREFKKMNMIAS